ncbi:hypothetical protein GGR58DRAFT_272618 [Xylaria digitata]|nr:hypothetical protein GGR58DRAFT_272618 [Xylaria digitata]
MTQSEEVVAAGPSGLFFFKRVQDHDSKPWSEGQPLPNTSKLNDSSVSGLAVVSTNRGNLYLYCVSSRKLHSFYHSQENGSSWVKDPYPPLSSYLVSGTPAVAMTSEEYSDSERWTLTVPNPSGGLLYTSTNGSSSASYSTRKTKWGPVYDIAKDLGIISSVSITAIHTETKSGAEKTVIVMACVAGGRLHTTKGNFKEKHSDYYSSGSATWKVQTPTRIHHPGEVTGNPMLVKKARVNQLDLLVPSAEGGMFHYVQTPSCPDEWHMIARITFPLGLPAASCLAVHYRDRGFRRPRKFYALIQSGGQLYRIETSEGANPWSRSYLKPIVAPGPFSD